MLPDGEGAMSDANALQTVVGPLRISMHCFGCRCSFSMAVLLPIQLRHAGELWWHGFDVVSCGPS